MKKSMESAYTDMMNNLAKSTAAIPLHLQAATGALAWWEQPDSLLAKSEIAPADALAKASAENETDEAYEEDEKKDAEKESDEDEKEESEDEEHDEDPEPAEEGMKKSLNTAALAVAAAPAVIPAVIGGAMIARDKIKNREQNKKRKIMEGKAKGPKMVSEEAPGYDVAKALSDLDSLATDMLNKADTYLKGQTEMFPDMPVPSKTYEEQKAEKKSKKKAPKSEQAK